MTVAVCHQIIANDKYLVGKTENGLKFFVNQDVAISGIKTLIPYASKTIDKENRGVGPFSKQNVKSIYYRHWLGTDSMGRDVLAGLIYGSYIALLVGLFTVLISLLLGILFGFLSGYYGNTNAYIRKQDLITWIVLLFIFTFYGFYLNGNFSKVLLLVPWLLLIYFIKKVPGIQRGTFSFPMDSIVLRLIEVTTSIPGLFLILILSTIFGKPSIWNVIIIIGLLRWPKIARHLRAEIIAIKEEQFVDSSKVLGLSDTKILWAHILPMSVSPLIIVSAFGFSAAILLESTLSFLGLGIPLDLVTWGSLIRESRNNFEAWWLAVFPGIMIYILIYLFNSIGDHINDSIKKV